MLYCVIELTLCFATIVSFGTFFSFASGWSVFKCIYSYV